MMNYSFLNEPFIALLSYDSPNDDIIIPINKASDYGIKFKLNAKNSKNIEHFIQKYPLEFKDYKARFDKVRQYQKNGHSYLLNLCFASKIKTNLNLDEIYFHAKGAAVIYKKDDFVCFTPEPFVVIKDGFIHTYPMKGTIDASVANAKAKLLNNQKEFSESAMMVDLMRNDLGRVCERVWVERFRYIQKVGNLYQTSSQISGKLRQNLSLGEIFSALLPAGSITGTPKIETMRIIKECEKCERGFYTGVFIHFDGKVCKSYVLIRFIKQRADGLYFYSGGGITLMSDVKSEYNELIQKIYFPF
mgnify:FL=1